MNIIVFIILICTSFFLFEKNRESNIQIQNLTKLNEKLRNEIEFSLKIEPWTVCQENNLKNDLNLPKNLITYDKNNRLIIKNAFDVKNFEDFYDIIVNIKSVKDIDKGWEIKMNEKSKKQYFELKMKKY